MFIPIDLPSTITAITGLLVAISTILQLVLHYRSKRQEDRSKENEVKLTTIKEEVGQIREHQVIATAVAANAVQPGPPKETSL